METRSLSVVNQLSALVEIQDFIEELSSALEFSQKLEMELILILEELVTNVINYAFDDESVHTINIQIDTDADKVIITLTDDGRMFDLREFDASSELNKTLENRNIGGVGIHLVKTMTDHISYERTNNKNIVVLTKKR